MLGIERIFQTLVYAPQEIETRTYGEKGWAVLWFLRLWTLTHLPVTHLDSRTLGKSKIRVLRPGGDSWTFTMPPVPGCVRAPIPSWFC